MSARSITDIFEVQFLNINSVNFFGPKLDFSVLSAMIGVAVMVMLGELEI